MKYNCQKKNKKNFLEIISSFPFLFWTSIFFSITTIILLCIVPFIIPSRALDVRDDFLFLGFYNINVNNNNLSINWVSIVLGIMVIISSIFIALSYWVFKNSTYYVYIKNSYLISLYASLIIFLLVFFVINVFNKLNLDINRLDIKNHGWLPIGTLPGEINFNYVFVVNISLDADGNLINTIFRLAKYSYVWITLILFFSIWVLSSLILLLYKKSCRLMI